jgi:hypothetical protein
VTPAVGRFTHCYFDFDGTSLHILNDWIYNDAQPVSAHCFNQFDAWTGGGAERWVIKVFGDNTVEVRLNGQPQPANFSGAAGAVGNGPSPNTGTNHSIFELSFPASPGGFGVQLHDPGPRFECGVLETEPARRPPHAHPLRLSSDVRIGTHQPTSRLHRRAWWAARPRAAARHCAPSTATSGLRSRRR